MNFAASFMFSPLRKQCWTDLLRTATEPISATSKTTTRYRAVKRNRRCWRKEGGSRCCITRNPLDTARTSAYPTTTTTPPPGAAAAPPWRAQRGTELRLCPRGTSLLDTSRCWTSITSNKEARKRCWNPEVSCPPATSPDTINSPTMWTPGTTKPSRANHPPFPPPQKGTTTALLRSRRLPTLPRLGSRRSPSTPRTTCRSWPVPPPKPNTSEIARRSTPEPSSASRRRPASYPNRPATGSEQTGLSRTGSWPSTSSLCSRFRIKPQHGESNQSWLYTSCGSHWKHWKRWTHSGLEHCNIMWGVFPSWYSFPLRVEHLRQAVLPIGPPTGHVRRGYVTDLHIESRILCFCYWICRESIFFLCWFRAAAATVSCLHYAKWRTLFSTLKKQPCLWLFKELM